MALTRVTRMDGPDMAEMAQLGSSTTRNRLSTPVLPRRPAPRSWSWSRRQSTPHSYPPDRRHAMSRRWADGSSFNAARYPQCSQDVSQSDFAVLLCSTSEAMATPTSSSAMLSRPCRRDRVVEGLTRYRSVAEPSHEIAVEQKRGE